MPDKIIAGGGLVANEKNELLMIFRKGKWDLPKGKLDDGETIEQCALREVEEETGLKNITISELIGITHHNYNNPWKSNNKTVKETYWFAMQVQGSNNILTPQAEEDIQKAEWANDVELEQNLQNTYPNIVEIIEKWKKAKK